MTYPRAQFKVIDMGWYLLNIRYSEEDIMLPKENALLGASLRIYVTVRRRLVIIEGLDQQGLFLRFLQTVSTKLS